MCCHRATLRYLWNKYLKFRYEYCHLTWQNTETARFLWYWCRDEQITSIWPWHWRQQLTLSVKTCLCFWVWKRVCVFVTHLQDASSIHSICAGGYSLKYPKMSCVLMSSTPVMWIASRRSREIAWYHRKKRNYRYKKMTHETTAGLKKYSRVFFTFLHHFLIQKNSALTAALLPTEMETSRSLLFPFNGLLKKYKCTTFQQTTSCFLRATLYHILGVCEAACESPETSQMFWNFSWIWVVGFLLLPSASHRMNVKLCLKEKVRLVCRKCVGKVFDCIVWASVSGTFEFTSIPVMKAPDLFS